MLSTPRTRVIVKTLFSIYDMIYGDIYIKYLMLHARIYISYTAVSSNTRRVYHQSSKLSWTPLTHSGHIWYEYSRVISTGIIAAYIVSSQLQTGLSIYPRLHVTHKPLRLNDTYSSNDVWRRTIDGPDPLYNLSSNNARPDNLTGADRWQFYHNINFMI